MGRFILQPETGETVAAGRPEDRVISWKRDMTPFDPEGQISE